MIAKLLVFSAAFFTTEAFAQLNEDFSQLRNRYGTATFSASTGETVDATTVPPPSMVIWRNSAGRLQVVASFIDGKANFLLYGNTDESACGLLRRQMLPPGQNWVDGHDARVYLEKTVEGNSLNVFFDPSAFHYWQSSDGKLWAVWLNKPSENIFFIGTPEGIKGALDLAMKWQLLPS